MQSAIALACRKKLIAREHLTQPGGVAQQAHKLCACALNQPTHNHRRTRSDSGSAVRDNARVRRRHDYVVEFKAQRCGGNLGEYVVRALAEFSARDEHTDLSFP